MAAKGGKDKKAPAKAVKKPRELHKRYDIQGETITKKNRNCPKCGAGYFLGIHKDRVVCGKCAYVEVKSTAEKQASGTANEGKKEEESKEVKTKE